ncbi:MAG: hypothetical protein JNL97_12160 [Verrucomicrobiales bacterium]|nr:hypothetical protein [Verrucomicrobiales bacterium]
MSSRTGRIVGWILVSWAGIAGSPGVRGATHQHLNAGAYGSEVGAALYFVNGDRFVASSGYAVPMERASVGAHGGL